MIVGCMVFVIAPFPEVSKTNVFSFSKRPLKIPNHFILLCLFLYSLIGYMTSNLKKWAKEIKFLTSQILEIANRISVCVCWVVDAVMLLHLIIDITVTCSMLLLLLFIAAATVIAIIAVIIRLEHLSKLHADFYSENLSY